MAAFEAPSAWIDFDADRLQGDHPEDRLGVVSAEDHIGRDIDDVSRPVRLYPPRDALGEIGTNRCIGTMPWPNAGSRFNFVPVSAGPFRFQMSQP